MDTVTDDSMWAIPFTGESDQQGNSDTLLELTTDAKQPFKIVKMKKPIIKDDEVLIQVEFFGLNFADISARKGNYADAPPFPFVAGYEVSGKL